MIQKFNDRNKDIKVWIDGVLLHRDYAKISVFDSVVQGGDAVWEGLRVYNGRIFYFDKHIDRLMESAKSMNFVNVPTVKEVKEAVFSTLKANVMKSEVHIRLTLTRGKKITSGMNPELNQSGCTLIVLAEWKSSIFYGKELSLVTSNIRRNSPLCLDSKIHHANLINNILAKIEANHAGVDDAVMLDLNGFVAETNSTNIFMIKGGVVITPLPNACLPGITRGLVIEICKRNNIYILERDISVTELYNADEVFTTGTMGELARVNEIDRRKIKNKGGLLARLQNLFKQLTETDGECIPF
ncbi:MAG: aminotransferase IV [Flavobacteriales bacterium]|nr:aminotransferase IV [Flavobacteriales bacterium]|tara:strand:- start:5 stop:901 length:897 start_codon:yes stop_codon:yes gene_type:complete